MSGAYYYDIISWKYHRTWYLALLFLVKQCLPQLECVAFLASHFCCFCVALIALSEEMEHAMDDDAMELLFKGDIKE
jgi:hypothetical protein